MTPEKAGGKNVAARAPRVNFLDGGNGNDFTDVSGGTG